MKALDYRLASKYYYKVPLIKSSVTGMRLQHLQAAICIQKYRKK